MVTNHVTAFAKYVVGVQYSAQGCNRLYFLMKCFTREFTNLNLLVCSSQEPDAKRQRVDDSSSGAANAMTDMQANNSAYNYNWYQVGFTPELLTALKRVSLL